MTTPARRLTVKGRVLLLGSGSVSRCLQPLLLRHLDMDFTKLTVMDFEDYAGLIPDTLAAGATYVRDRITPENMAETLAKYVGDGDLLINLSWNIGTEDIIDWCQDHGVRYVDTSVELWDPYADQADTPPVERTLYHRHMGLRKKARSWRPDGPTAVVEHGANPGLVSHWTKVALEDIAKQLLKQGVDEARRAKLEGLLDAADYPHLAHDLGVKVIHISERDTQISDKPKEVGEFVNTWSIEGFYEEGVAPAEMGWGTHERTLPANAHTHAEGPRNQICLAQAGHSTWVRSWVPEAGSIHGMVVRHGEAMTISDYLTVWNGDEAVYRPTVHYAYLPTDAAIASWLECRMNGYRLQEPQRIMTDEIVSGRDELGVLLMGHDLTSWWVGSQLDIHEARELVPGQNATTLQVAASVLGAIAWILDNPDAGLCTPEDLDHKVVLDWANPYLGPTPSVQSDWTPLTDRYQPFEKFVAEPGQDDVWQFGTFLV
ncbi:saccharopine dehydrogenase C-terminal domain-containing protein [Nonomuraea sp. NPDC050663]|uniref:saccharopine dehydrogenase C-terminal domain-containing protein n=1 Tax=Nonomuraea sp. NPDC050663 TaxID=3364370 RepID=UPI0037B151DB